MLLMNWSFGYDWVKPYMNAEALTDIMVNTEYMREMVQIYSCMIVRGQQRL